MVSYEDKKYRKGIIIEEGFLHGHFDYFYQKAHDEDIAKTELQSDVTVAL